MSLAYPQTVPNFRRHWLAGTAVALVALSVVPWVVSFGPVSGEAAGLLAAAIVQASAGGMMMIAARRQVTSARLGQALTLMGLSILLASGGNAVRLAASLGVDLPSIPGLGLVSDLAIWALGLVALIRIPLAPIAPGAAWRIAMDTAISGLGMALVIFVIWTLPGLRAAPPDTRRTMMLYDVIEGGYLMVFNLILVRGPAPEIRRAVMWLSATVLVETFYLVAFQYGIGYHDHNAPLNNSLFFVDYLFYMMSAACFMSGPEDVPEVRETPTLARMVNPLPVFAVLGVGGLLVFSALQNAGLPVKALSVGIVLMSFLLVGRIVASSSESLRLLHDKADEEQRVQAAKLELMRRMSGGISHIINNLMAVVHGHAQLLRTDVAAHSLTRESLDAISSSALKASGLAERLGLASGIRNTAEGRKRLREALLPQHDAVRRQLGQKRDLEWDLPEGEGKAMVAPTDVEAIVRELVANAGEATFHGGKIAIRVRDELLQPDGPAASAQPSHFTVVEVSDTGRGIAEADLPHVLEPFFTNRPFHEGRGLGLSVVHGIAASYGGGLIIDTVPGSGSRIRVYFPIGDAPAA